MSVNFIVSTIGSPGDVHPFIEGSRALRRRGHQVTLSSLDHFQAARRSARIALVSAGRWSDLADLLQSNDVVRPSSVNQIIKYLLVAPMRPVYEAIAARNIPGKTVLVNFTLVAGARLANEKLGIPLVTLHLA